MSDPITPATLFFYEDEIAVWPESTRSHEIWYTQLDGVLYRIDHDDDHTGVFRYRRDLPQTRMETIWDLLATDQGDCRADLLTALPTLTGNPIIRTLSTATL